MLLMIRPCLSCSSQSFSFSRALTERTIITALSQIDDLLESALRAKALCQGQCPCRGMAPPLRAPRVAVILMISALALCGYESRLGGSRWLHCVSPVIMAQLGRDFPGLLRTSDAYGEQGALCSFLVPFLAPPLQIFCVNEVIYLSLCRVMIEVCYLAVQIKCLGAASSLLVIILRMPRMRSLPEEVLKPSPCSV